MKIKNNSKYDENQIHIWLEYFKKNYGYSCVYYVHVGKNIEKEFNELSDEDSFPEHWDLVNPFKTLSPPPNPRNWDLSILKVTPKNKNDLKQLITLKQKLNDINEERLKKETLKKEEHLSLKDVVEDITVEDVREVVVEELFTKNINKKKDKIPWLFLLLISLPAIIMFSIF